MKLPSNSLFICLILSLAGNILIISSSVANPSSGDVSSVVALLLSKKNNCVSYDDVEILSISSNRNSPYSEVQLLVKNSASVIPGEAVVAIDDIRIPVHDVDHSTGQIATILPNTPGKVSVQIIPSCGSPSNISSFTIGPLALPEGETVEGVMDKFISEMDRLNTESPILNEFNTILAFIREYTKALTTSEMFELACFLSGPLSKVGSYESMEPIPSSKVAGDKAMDWDTILDNRKHVSRARRVTEAFSWGNYGVLTEYPVIKIIDKALNVLTLLESSAGFLPVLLDELNIDISFPDGEFYRTNQAAELTCKGTFIPYIEAFIERAFSTVFNQLTELIQKGVPKVTLKTVIVRIKAGDIVIDGPTLEAIEGTAAAEMVSGIISKISSVMNKFYEKSYKATNVTFPCNFFLRRLVLPSTKKVGLTWGEKISATPLIPGRVQSKVLISENLAAVGKVVTGSLDLEVKNKLPKIDNEPVCVVNTSGDCTFALTVSDEDDANHMLKIKNISASYGQVSYSSSSPSFDINYSHNQLPIVKNISVIALPEQETSVFLNASIIPDYEGVVINVCDPYDCVKKEVSVNFSTYTDHGPEAFHYSFLSNPLHGTLKHVTGNQFKYKPQNKKDGKEENILFNASIGGKQSKPQANLKIYIAKECLYSKSDSHFASPYRRACLVSLSNGTIGLHSIHISTRTFNGVAKHEVKSEITEKWIAGLSMEFTPSYYHDHSEGTSYVLRQPYKSPVNIWSSVYNTYVTLKLLGNWYTEDPKPLDIYSSDGISYKCSGSSGSAATNVDFQKCIANDISGISTCSTMKELHLDGSQPSRLMRYCNGLVSSKMQYPQLELNNTDCHAWWDHYDDNGQLQTCSDL